MLESCYCGRTGEIEDREPVTTEDSERALGCPNCGHLDRLDWLSEETRRHVYEEAGPGARGQRRDRRKRSWPSRSHE